MQDPRNDEPTAALDDLYREVILDHYRSPRNSEPVPDPDFTAEGQNPFCGDEVYLQVKMEGERIARIGLRGQGCSISQASASMMTEVVLGKTLDEAMRLSRLFRALMHGRELSPEDLEALGDLEALQGVRKFPVRIKCALLAWMALEEGVERYRAGKG